MMVQELLLLIKTVLSISAKMYILYIIRCILYITMCSVAHPDVFWAYCFLEVNDWIV